MKKTRSATTVHASSDWESDLGGKIFTGVGALALVIGMGYFLRYAFENNLITEPVRVLLGALGGALLLFIGERTRSKYTLYSQILTGAALAIWYLTSYSSAAFYHLVDWKISALGMVLTTALGIYLALRENSIILAAFAGIGAYLVPTLLDPIEGKAMITFTYLTIVNVMVFTLAIKKQWKQLLILAFAGDILLTGSWMQLYFKADQLLVMTAYNTLFIAMMLGAYWIFDHGKKKLQQETEDLILIAGASIFSAIIYSSICVQSGAENWKGVGALLIGLVCVGLSTHLKRYASAFLYTGLFLVVAAAPLQFEALGVSLTWSGLMLAGVLFMFRNNRVEIRYTVYLLFILNVYAILQMLMPTAGSFWDDRTIAEIPFIIAALAMTATLLPKVQDEREDSFLKIAFVFTNLLVLMLAARKWADYTDAVSLQQLGTSGVWAIYATIIMAVGALKKAALLRKTGVLILTLVILKVFLVDSQNFDTLYKFIAYFGLGLILLVVGFLYERHKKEIKSFVKGK